MKYFKNHADRVKWTSSMRSLRLAKIEDILLLLSGGVIFALMLLTTCDVTGRYLFNSPILGEVEISEILLIFIIYLSLLATQRTGTHIGMDAILELLKRKKRASFYHGLQIFNFFIALVIFVIATYIAASQGFFASFTGGEETQGPLFLKQWPGKLCATICLALLCVRLAIELTKHVKGLTARGAKARDLEGS